MATSNRTSRVARIITCCVAGVLAVTLVAAGGWALWVDRVERDDAGFVSTGPLRMHTETYAIVGDLRGDGPAWLYGSTVLGDAQVRVHARGESTLFVGIARKADVDRYLAGAGYATIDHFGTSAETTHPGRAPSNPRQSSIWAVSRIGAGEMTVPWTPRSGDWRIVMMNADAGAGVSVRGTLAAEVPVLPWVAGGALLCGLLAARAPPHHNRPVKGGRRSSPPAAQQPSEPRTPVTA
jgi:hypothetical protein